MVEGIQSPGLRQLFWRDIDRKSLSLELLARISLIVGGLLVLAAVVTACYYLATTTRTINIYERVKSGWGPGYINNIIGTYESSNAGFMAFPIILMTPISIPFFVGAGVVNLERGHGDAGNLSREPEKTDRLLAIKKCPDFNAARQFISDHGGIGPLVRNGLLTIDQGNTLARMFTDQEKTSKILAKYTTYNAPNLNPNDYAHIEEYRINKYTSDGLDARWQEWKKEILPQWPELH